MNIEEVLAKLPGGRGPAGPCPGSCCIEKRHEHRGPWVLLPDARPGEPVVYNSKPVGRKAPGDMVVRRPPRGRGETAGERESDALLIVGALVSRLGGTACVTDAELSAAEGRRLAVGADDDGNWVVTVG